MKIISDINRSIKEKLVENSEISDIRPWNILMTSRGAQIIDYKYTADLNPRLKFNKIRDFCVILVYLLKNKIYWNFIFKIGKLVKAV